MQYMCSCYLYHCLYISLNWKFPRGLATLILFCMWILFSHCYLLQTHIEACVELLRHVQVSWSEEVEELIRGCLDVGHPACSSLKKQCRLVQLKRLLQGYEIRCFNFADVTRGWVSVWWSVCKGGGGGWGGGRVM